MASEESPFLPPLRRPLSEYGGIAIASDGLPARVIKPHTLEKYDRHGRYGGIFNKGMQYLWPENRGYLELFAASGMAIDEETGDEVTACPLNAALLAKPGFNRLAYVEIEPELAAALEQRLRRRGIAPDRARVFCGDANDHAMLAAAIAFLTNPGLVFTFIDPEDINFEWQALRFLAERRHPRLDLLINVPVNPIERAIGRRHFDPIVRFLGTDEWLPAVLRGADPAETIRRVYRAQLDSLGFAFVRDKEIKMTGSSRNLYDLFFASRNERAVDFWDAIQRIDAYGQRELFSDWSV